jgi:hypothetical protein
MFVGERRLGASLAFFDLTRYSSYPERRLPAGFPLRGDRFFCYS